MPQDSSDNNNTYIPAETAQVSAIFRKKNVRTFL